MDFVDWLTTETTQLLLQGLALTLVLTAITSPLALAIGVAVGTLRLSKRRGLRWLAATYVDVLRNIPALVLIIFWAFALPNLFPVGMRRMLFFDNRLMEHLQIWSGLSVPYYTLAAALALTLNTSAYLAELFRAGSQARDSCPNGHRPARSGPSGFARRRRFAYYPA